MFGWFKRKPKRIIGTVNQDAVQAAMARLAATDPMQDTFKVKLEGFPEMAFQRKDRVRVTILVFDIRSAKRQKKKHSHFLAELKALEVKE